MDVPVQQLMFGDAGAGHEYGFHTLGPLKCSDSKWKVKLI